ncbi:response regulator transcription factor [uncultured Agrobacterium sp.]|uniref:winged helix-turn-helix transcriptional regulator n=1 Tax=Agrobacterium sp. 22094 TaxID=3453872 RepID=UPI0025DD2C8D|nr:response regulator transcription factor [uncultured Agrobacterium sp.]
MISDSYNRTSNIISDIFEDFVTSKLMCRIKLARISMTENATEWSKIAVYTNNPDYFTILKHILNGAGFSALLCNRKDLEEKLSVCGVAGIVLDAEVDDAVSVCRLIKSKEATTALPLLAAIPNGNTELYMSLMREGADQCLVRPFWPPHLIAFLRSINFAPGSKHDRPSAVEASQLWPIEVDHSRKQAIVNGKSLHLGPIEFKLLSHLLSDPGRVFSRNDLIENAWPPEVYVQLRTVDVHVGRLRRQLQTALGRNVIRTARTNGYAIEFDMPEGGRTSTEL